MVVEIHPEDVVPLQLPRGGEAAALEENKTGALCMLEFQEQLEKMTWQQGNMKQTAPAQRMVDFVNGRLSYDLPKVSYAPGVVSSPLHFWLPKPISRRLQEGF